MFIFYESLSFTSSLLLLNFSFPVSFLLCFYFFVYKFIFYTFCIHSSSHRITTQQHWMEKNIQIKAKPNSSNSFYFIFGSTSDVSGCCCDVNVEQKNEREKKAKCEFFWNEKKSKKSIEFMNFLNLQNRVKKKERIRHMLNSKIPNWQEEKLKKKVRMHAKCLSTPDF